MKLEIICDSRDSAILVCDEDHNDIAEFFHSDHATVGQSYETALMLARKLVEATNSQFILQSCREAKQCLHIVPGCICDGDPHSRGLAPSWKGPAMSEADLRPRAFNLDDPAEVRRLLRECEGYLHTCRRDHHGTDFEGRRFAMVALRALAERYPQESASE